MNETLTAKANFIVKIGSMLHKYGTNAPRIEAALKSIAHYLGLTGNFFSTPTYLAISINSGSEQIMRHIRINPGVPDLERLCDVDEIAESVCYNGLSIEKAMMALSIVDQRAERYHPSIVLLAFGLTSFALAIIFGGNLPDLLISTVMGISVGLLNIMSRKYESFGQLFEFFAAFITVIIVAFLKNNFPAIHLQIIVLSSLIVIIPGLTLTISMAELATKNLVSGTARLMGAIIDFLKLSLGVMLGLQVGRFFLGELKQDFATPLHELWIIPAVIIGATSLAIIFKARLRDIKWVLLSGALAILTIKLSGIWVTNEIAIFFASFVVGASSNILARVNNRPTMIMFLPGVIFLVPGSIAFKGMNLIFKSNYLEGIGIGLQVFVISITIVAGLFFANVLVNPRRSL